MPLTESVLPGYPAFCGHLHIASDDIYTPPDFDSGILSHNAPLSPHNAISKASYKKGREFLHRLGVYHGTLAAAQAYVEAGSPAATALAQNGPVALDAPKTAYSKEESEAIAANVRNFGEFEFRLSNLNLGTCPMKPREQGGVVDKDLDNTYSATLAIGGKVALIIAYDLGINGV
ncbi:hypothetical protein ARMGADRAFT_1036008 [Armillaria gallica]|uniref:Uncharacterized protein n=1 Tax=Armillaria gallica TaxID=47427 RepID=A0A2H3CS12_ARMGA|nr:hypothetical protein ARMGADRAFT_1036008 [Armillaria gallica]